MVSGKKELLFYGGRVVLKDGGKAEYANIMFDYDSYEMKVTCSKTIIVPFKDFKNVSESEKCVQVLFIQDDVMSRLECFTLSSDDKSNLYQLIDNIISNIDLLESHPSLFRNLFDSFKPKICMRSSTVTTRTLQIKGATGKFGKLVKKTVKKSEPLKSRTIGFLLMTESHLFCFEESNSSEPMYIFPNSSLQWKSKSDGIGSFTSSHGDKGSFQFIDMDDLSMWIAAFEKTKDIREQEILELEPIINEIQTNFRTTFDKENKEHVQLLRRLWEATGLGTHPSKGHVPFEIQCERWTVLGFQRNDPSSDLRASGLLGLQNLVYFAETYTGLFLEMARSQLLVETDMYYPFATAGINISYLMVTLLHLSKEEVWCPEMPMHPLFFHTSRAWEELYTIIFRLFDQKWKQMQVGYMGFQKVIDITKENTYELLRKNSVMGIPAIFDMLGILLEDLDSFRTTTLEDPSKDVGELKLRPNPTTGRISRSSTMSAISEKKEKQKNCNSIHLDLNLDLSKLSASPLSSSNTPLSAANTP